MKKILVCALILVLCVTALVACNPGTDGLDSAKEYLETMYAKAAVETGKDYTRPAIVKIGDVTYDVAWSVEITSGPKTVTVSEPVNSMVTINVDEFSAETVVYTLKATIKDAKGNTTDVSFNHKVPAFGLNTYEEYVAACIANAANSDKETQTVVNVKGYVVGVNADSGSSSKGSLWIVDANGNGYYAYKPTLDTTITESREAIEAEFPRGTEIVVKGKPVDYSGCYEFQAGCEIIKTGNSVDPATLPYVDRTQLFTDATSISDESLVATQATRALINGVTMGTVDQNNYYFSIGDVDFIFYMNIYLLTPEQQNTLKAMWVEGGKANLKGVINVYSGKYQLYPDGLDSIEIVQENLTDAEKVARQKEILTLDETYNANFTLPVGTWANIAWAVEGEGATLGDNGAVTINQTSAEQTVTITATITSGEATDTKVFTVKIAAARTSFIKAALNAGAELEDKTATTDSYIVIGTVSRIKEAYSEQYKNISFYVVDAEGNELLVYRYNLEDAATIAVGDAVAFAAPIKKYGTDIEAVADFVALDVMSLADAAAAGLAGTGVEGTVVYGYVKSIDTAYDSGYDNITVTISDGTNDFYIYRMKGGETLAVGDYILITGTPSSYKGAAQMAQGATYVASPIYTAPSGGETPDPNPGEGGGETPDPNPGEGGGETGTITTIAGALAGAEGAAVELTGTVVEIYQSWNSQYNNISFYISDGTNRILAYRAGSVEVFVGDEVKVVGTITNYNSAMQIAQGGTITVLNKHVCSDFTEASCLVAAKCTVCNKENGSALGHTDEADSNGLCDRCETNLQDTILPSNLEFSAAANKASADDYMNTNFPEWTINGKLGQTYGGYLGFGRSGDGTSSIKSSEISTTEGFTITTVLKGNGSSGVATSTLTFTLVDASGNVVATGYADGASTAAITPADGKDTTYTITFTFEDGKSWADVSNLVISFAKATGNIGLKSLTFNA